MWKPLRFDGLGEFEEFIEEFQEQVPTEVRTGALDIALKETPVRWWGTHKESLKEWEQVKRMMKIIFGHNLVYFDTLYTREEFTLRHIDICIVKWTEHNVPEEEWIHHFIHSLDMVPKN